MNRKAGRKTAKYHVRIFKMGEAEVPAPEVYWMSGWGQWETLFFYMVLIQGQGLNAVINTGPPEDLTDLNARWNDFAGRRCQFKRRPSELPEIALRSAGLGFGDVTHVLVTPLQLYATGNLSRFPNAQICFSRRGWIQDVLARPAWLHVSREQCISNETLSFLLFSAPQRLRLLDNDEEICPGIHASWVGTHHRSSMLFSIQTSRGTVGVSDCAFTYRNLDGHPLGIAESIIEGHAAYQKIRNTVDHFVPLYDPAALDRYKGGIVA
jgi:glyoxylase-like metal-dependent hydrolase (beta-lactamase superfamily II)